MTTLVHSSTASTNTGASFPGLDPPPDPAVLERNLAALSRTCARTAGRVRYSPSRSDLRFLATGDGVASVEVPDPLGIGPARALASRRHPLCEAKLLAETVDIASTAAVAVMGFGAGHHVAALARRMRRTGIIAVFEPDLGLLRAVLERIDCSAWLAESNTAIFTDPDDSALISASLSGVEGIVMMGLSLLEHPPSLERLGEARTRFYANFQDVIRAVRTTVATTMVQVQTTVANVVRNLGWYSTSPGIGELAGSCAGRPAIVVSAGPSLQRNIAELTRPGVRDRFTIIAAQTVLKPLLERGVRPHFVVALDHSEISARFYEGLAARDVEGVTLVVEPKVSPAVPRAFPGEVRLAADPFLDMLLGDDLRRPMGALPPGATVAHLAYYLARHLGADPVVLVGQDLGFTDGQYYAAGASIHNVWASELNQFNTLERMEWERIKRMGSHLRRATDHRGRPIYTDDQLATYLAQFERDFLADSGRGLSIIDATEGGVAKRYTGAEALAGVIDRFLSAPEAPKRGARKEEAQRGARSIRRIEERVREVQRGVHDVAGLCREAASLLKEMLSHHADQPRVTRLIEEVHAVRDRVEKRSPAIELVHYLNQAGAFARVRADRSIHLDPSLSPLERQKREIERDLVNVEQLGRTADHLGRLLMVSAQTLVRWGTGDRLAVLPTAPTRAESGPASVTAQALVAIDAETLERAARPMAGTTPLRLMIERLSRAERVESIVLLTSVPEAVSEHVRGVRSRVPVRVHRAGDDDVFGLMRERLRSARAPAARCWRGGLGSASVFDEILAPEAMLAAMEELSIGLALVVGADWCLVDPLLTDAVIERASRCTGTHRLGFSQAPPGVCGCAINTALLADLVRLRRGTSTFATMGGLLGYMPAAPALDPIGGEGCAAIDASVRDAGVRLVPDSPEGERLIEHVLARLGPARAASAASAEIVAIAESLADAGAAPAELTLEIARAIDGVVTPTCLSEGRLISIIAEFAAAAPGGMLTLRDDEADMARLSRLIDAAGSRGGMTVHLRSQLIGAWDAAALIGAAPDIVSVDFPADPACAAWQEAHRRVEALVANSRATAGAGRRRTWIVPRVIKGDATLDVVEGFYDRWLLTTGAAAIDSSATDAGDRIAPLPLPASAKRRFDRTCLYVRVDGTVRAHEWFDRAGRPGAAVADLGSQCLAEAWGRVRAERGAA